MKGVGPKSRPATDGLCGQLSKLVSSTRRRRPFARAWHLPVFCGHTFKLNSSLQTMDVISQPKQRRTFRKYSYRGVEVRFAHRPAFARDRPFGQIKREIRQDVDLLCCCDYSSMPCWTFPPSSSWSSSMPVPAGDSSAASKRDPWLSSRSLERQRRRLPLVRSPVSSRPTFGASPNLESLPPGGVLIIAYEQQHDCRSRDDRLPGRHLQRQGLQQR